MASADRSHPEEGFVKGGFSHPVPSGSRPRRTDPVQRRFELEFFRIVLERDPDYADALKAHADNLAADGQIEQAWTADRRLVELRPDRPIPWYNLACSSARLGREDEALDALEKALQLGYKPLSRVRRDRDLKSLRRHPRFRKLVARAGAEPPAFGAHPDPTPPPPPPRT